MAEPNSSHVERIKDAAYERWRAESARRRDLEKLLKLRSDARLGDVIHLGDDVLVEVISFGRHVGQENTSTWTTVVGGSATPYHHRDQESAVLHLIARRHGDGEGRSVPYAARVLGIPEADA